MSEISFAIYVSRDDEVIFRKIMTEFEVEIDQYREFGPEVAIFDCHCDLYKSFEQFREKLRNNNIFTVLTY